MLHNPAKALLHIGYCGILGCVYHPQVLNQLVSAPMLLDEPQLFPTGQQQPQPQPAPQHHAAEHEQAAILAGEATGAALQGEHQAIAGQAAAAELDATLTSDVSSGQPSGSQHNAGAAARQGIGIHAQGQGEGESGQPHLAHQQQAEHSPLPDQPQVQQQLEQQEQREGKEGEDTPGKLEYTGPLRVARTMSQMKVFHMM
jgi:hypothetical protein